MSLPLEGIRVLDLSRMLPGPFCTQILADYGAEVIKIEDKSGDHARWMPPYIGEQGARFYAVNRNKKSIILDLKREEGKAIFRKLAAISDVVVDVFRPGVMEKLGLSYDVLKEVNERIIYCAINGYGSTGPLSKTAAHDINILSLAGITGLTGTKDGPPSMTPIQLAGTVGGSLYAVIAILLALADRQKTGQGQFCDISMMDGSISLLAYTLAEQSGWDKVSERGNELLTGGYAFYQIYETKDNRYLSLGAVEAKFWEEFCQRIGRPEYIGLQRNPEVQEKLIADIQNVIKGKSQAEWLEIFADINICLTPVLNIDEMFEHPQVKAREMIKRVENFKDSGKDLLVTGLPIKMSASPGEFKFNYSEAGEYTTEVLLMAGYSAEEIELYKISGVVWDSEKRDRIDADNADYYDFRRLLKYYRTTFG